MDVGKFTSGVVGIAVSVIIVVSVAFPVITKAASTEGLMLLSRPCSKFCPFFWSLQSFLPLSACSSPAAASDFATPTGSD